ncbi:hypothetical protein MTO96_002205 [Rhipicephalus appendiculatus]
MHRPFPGYANGSWVVLLGPMRQVQEYVSVGWRFAGMKHVHLILEFLRGRNSWVLDIIPELRAKGEPTAGTI